MMPKGFKAEKGYSTVTDIGKSYQEISDIMTKQGYKMNHSTVRNIINRAMKKIATDVCKQVNSNVDPERISRDPEFHSGIFEIFEDHISGNIK